MSEVGQAQVLNRLMKLCLNKFRPESFALLGCSTGNGLEHINNEITKIVYATDINNDYLKITKDRFLNKISELQILNIDINNDKLKIKNVDLVFAGLIFEYIKPLKALPEIIEILSDNGIFAIVIQKNHDTTFVSKTKYKSLEKLSTISNEVNETEIRNFMLSKKNKFNSSRRNKIVKK